MGSEPLVLRFFFWLGFFNLAVLLPLLGTILHIITTTVTAHITILDWIAFSLFHLFPVSFFFFLLVTKLVCLGLLH